MREFFDAIRRTLGLYDSHGLKYSIDHLRSIQHQIIFYPIAQQAMYADQITVQHVAYGMERLGDLPNFPINTTAVGNLAYIALYSRDELVQARAKMILSEYRKWAKEQAFKPTNP